MQQLIAVAIAGLVAQLVDGALGMGYGLTSSTLLIATGLTPAAASASVHLAEVGTTAVSGVAHHRFNNVDWHTVRRIAIPGGIGAFLGATFLSSISTEFAKPLASSLLFTLGIYVLLRFLLGKVRVAVRRCGWSTLLHSLGVESSPPRSRHTLFEKPILASLA